MDELICNLGGYGELLLNVLYEAAEYNEKIHINVGDEEKNNESRCYSMIHGAIIEEHCLLGMNSVILEGSVIGKGSIIAAGSVILKNTNIPPHSLVIGVPGKVIKEIPESWDQIHAQALKYKTLWTERYGLLPNVDGERYKGEKII